MPQLLHLLGIKFLDELLVYSPLLANLALDLRNHVKLQHQVEQEKAGSRHRKGQDDDLLWLAAGFFTIA